jgi:hypothetical protein
MINLVELILNNGIYIQNIQQILLLILSVLIIIGVEMLYNYNSKIYGAISYIPGITPPTPPNQTSQIPPVNTIAKKRTQKKK